jgi:NADH-quinone oxidoreductase subunit J
LEVIIYAGAIMVLFVFVVMLLNLGQAAIDTERTWFHTVSWTGPFILVAVLVAEFAYLLRQSAGSAHPTVIAPAEVGSALFGSYMLGVELASMLLLGGLVGAYHLGRRASRQPEAE